jgi:hypothetical protein
VRMALAVGVFEVGWKDRRPGVFTTATVTGLLGGGEQWFLWTARGRLSADGGSVRSRAPTASGAPARSLSSRPCNGSPGSITTACPSALGDIPPVEFEAQNAPNPADLSVTTNQARTANGLTTSRASTIGVDFAAHSPIASVSAPAAQNGSAQAATNSDQGTNCRPWPLRPPVHRHTH